MKKNEKGFSVVEILLVVVVVGSIGVVGWLVYDRQKSDKNTQHTDTQSSDTNNEATSSDVAKYSQPIKKGYELFENKDIFVQIPDELQRDTGSDFYFIDMNLDSKSDIVDFSADVSASTNKFNEKLELSKTEGGGFYSLAKVDGEDALILYWTGDRHGSSIQAYVYKNKKEYYFRSVPYDQETGKTVFISILETIELK